MVEGSEFFCWLTSWANISFDQQTEQMLHTKAADSTDLHIGHPTLQHSARDEDLIKKDKNTAHIVWI